MAHCFLVLLIRQLRSMLWVSFRETLLCCMVKRVSVSAMAPFGVDHIFIGAGASVVASLVASPTFVVTDSLDCCHASLCCCQIPLCCCHTMAVQTAKGRDTTVEEVHLRLLSCSSDYSLVVAVVCALFKLFSAVATESNRVDLTLLKAVSGSSSAYSLSKTLRLDTFSHNSSTDISGCLRR